MPAFILFLGFLTLALASGQDAQVSEAKASDRKPWLSDLPPLPDIEPISRTTIDASIGRGVDFLISSQNKNGSWGSAP